MENWLARTEMLLGEEAVKELSEKHVAIFGVGGVGGYIAEALARSGVGHIDLIDHDKIDITNINRQIIATHSTVGRYKVEVMKERILDIKPSAEVNTYTWFYLPENADSFDLSRYDYIADAIDTVTAKLELIVRAQICGTPIISSMGTGNKLNPCMLEIENIKKTSVCPLARVMRRELKQRGVDDLKVLYSKEQPVRTGERVPASSAFVPAAAGLIIAAEIVKDMIMI